MTEASTPQPSRPHPPEDFHWGISYLREDIQDLKQEMRDNAQEVREEMRVLHGRMDAMNTSLNTRIDETAKKLDASVTDLRAQVLNAGTLANFGTSITNLKMFTEQALGAVKNINGIVETNGTQVGLAVSNAVLFSEELTRLATSAQALLDTNGVTISVAAKNLAETTETFKKIAGDLQAGKGLAGTVLQNPELATNFQIIAANLAVTSSNLNRLGLWGILWSRKPLMNTNPVPANSPRSTRP